MSKLFLITPKILRIDNGTEFVNKRLKVIYGTWVYKVIYVPDGPVERLKARLVDKGFTHTARVGYFKTFALVVKMTTLKTILMVAATKNDTVPN